jgi:hypothetical protein
MMGGIILYTLALALYNLLMDTAHCIFAEPGQLDRVAEPQDAA